MNCAIQAPAAALRSNMACRRALRRVGGHLSLWERLTSPNSYPYVLWLRPCSAATTGGNRPPSPAGIDTRARRISEELRILVSHRAPHAFQNAVRVNAYQRSGFTVNGFLLKGTALLLLSNCIIGLPRLQRVSQLTGEVLAVFELLEQRPSILLVGIGETQAASLAYWQQVPNACRSYLEQSLRMRYEVTTASNACATFNFLNDENRLPAALLFPLHMTADEP
ncbi:hypothetical protein CDCA_CDCA08G2385 [Cyanidium caldarium]|uniref:NADH dehydrogenase [ubiquinone] 1 alpha subcomplex assembly factor 3 n=1 Tax=Cyanidium caldarium TaxID=2771 RepID=A0AAV9IVM2_CYACA|nr:hypothetical protein CDCA_CDCA08G2385 [Cyanidium caldarium]|eukprot:ctg_324.g216